MEKVENFTKCSFCFCCCFFLLSFVFSIIHPCVSTATPWLNLMLYLLCMWRGGEWFVENGMEGRKLFCFFLFKLKLKLASMILFGIKVRCHNYTVTKFTSSKSLLGLLTVNNGIEFNKYLTTTGYVDSC